ncbi:monothiol glutaredoxin-S2-like protein [Tanacetum coccineum]
MRVQTQVESDVAMTKRRHGNRAAMQVVLILEDKPDTVPYRQDQTLTLTPEFGPGVTPGARLTRVPQCAVTSLVAEKPVVIFSKSSCCMSHTIKTLIYSFGANPTVYELDEHPNGKQLEKELKALGRKPSVPAVYIGQELIGGPNEIMTLHLKGKLVQLLKKANAIWV